MEYWGLIWMSWFLALFAVGPCYNLTIVAYDKHPSSMSLPKIIR